MRYRIVIDLRRALTGRGIDQRAEAMAELLQEQTLDRIETGGDDEIRFEKLAFKRYDGSKDHPLWHNGSHLHSSITHGVDGDGPWVGSTFEGAAVHQFGTKGKSAEGVGQGTMPTIVPKNAKALFIPLTPRAAKSTRVSSGGRILRKYRKKVGNQHGSATKMIDLVRGKDFILVQKVDLPPRPFLRVSPDNLKELADVIATGEK